MFEISPESCMFVAEIPFSYFYFYFFVLLDVYPARTPMASFYSMSLFEKKIRNLVFFVCKMSSSSESYHVELTTYKEVHPVC